MRLTKQYAYALLASIPDEKALDFYDELTQVAKVFDNLTDYVSMVEFQPEEFSSIRETLADDVDPLVINFLQVLANDAMLSRLNTTIEDYRLVLVEANLLYDVHVFSARPLSQASQTQIEKLVETRWGSNYLLSYQVDKKILGGLRLEVNGAVVDTTFRSRIDQIIREVQHGSKK